MKSRFISNDEGCDQAAADIEYTALQEALAKQAEQKPVAIDGLARACNLAGIDYKDFLRIKAYLPIAAPVRTKDLTDDDLLGIWFGTDGLIEGLRAVIAADREKNHG